MNCTCIIDQKQKIAAYAAEHMGAVNPSATASFLGINLSTGESTISLDYIVRAENRPFNTSKGKSIAMVASFCPFCGVSMKKAPAQPAEPAAPASPA